MAAKQELNTLPGLSVCWCAMVPTFLDRQNSLTFPIIFTQFVKHTNMAYKKKFFASNANALADVTCEQYLKAHSHQHQRFRVHLYLHQNANIVSTRLFYTHSLHLRQIVYGNKIFQFHANINVSANGA